MPSIRIGVIDFLIAMPVDFHPRITRHGKKRRRFLVRIQRSNHHRIASPGIISPTINPQNHNMYNAILSIAILPRQSTVLHLAEKKPQSGCKNHHKKNSCLPQPFITALSALLPHGIAPLIRKIQLNKYNKYPLFPQ